MRGTRAAVQRAAYTFGMKHLQRWQERQNRKLILSMHNKEDWNTNVLSGLWLCVCVFSTPWKNDGRPYEVLWMLSIFMCEPQKHKLKMEYPDSLSFCLSRTSFLLSKEFLPVCICFFPVCSLWLVFGMGKLWETQPRVILLWRDMYQNKQQLHFVHRPGISQSRENGQTQSVLIS